jgi:ABC-type phosphate transport system substrate-binding protein
MLTYPLGLQGVARWALLGAIGVVTAVAPARPLTAAQTLTAAADAFIVVVHPDNPATHIDRDDLSRMFFKKITKWSHGSVVLPVDLPAQDQHRIGFTKHVHRKSVGAVRAFWQQQIFSGRDVPPPEKGNDLDVVSYVKEHPGAVGYLSGRQAPPGVKALTVDGVQQ